jgi:hypothetical protein
MYDIIGDIHGHADELVELLQTLGYRKSKIVFRHPERQAIFLGDFIDRGPQIRHVLEIVQPMINMGFALAVMGNHELNALAFHTKDPNSPGECLRPHTDKNTNQHSETLRQLSPDYLNSSLDWFRTLPLWLDLPDLRAVHACWDDEEMKKIAAGRNGQTTITDEFLFFACTKGQPLFHPTEIVLKGKEGELPQGRFFYDKEGNMRHEIRTKWYLHPEGHSYRSYALQSDPVDCDLAVEPDVIRAAAPYPATAKPVFVGHYWLSEKQPTILADNVACLDYSVAKGGFLCAYRWDGEQKLSNDKFVWVKARG